MAVGFALPATGLARVFAGLLEPLSKRWEIHVAGIGHHGPPFDWHGVRVHPAPLGGDVFGAYAAARLAAELEPAALLVYQDLWHLPRYLVALSDAVTARRAAYLPLDGALSDPEAARHVLGYDEVLVFSRWARAELERALATTFDGTRSGRDLPRRPRIGVLEHGLDRTTFHPGVELMTTEFAASGRAAAKRRVFPGLDPEASFVVLNASRPGERKRIDLTLEAFALVAKETPPSVRLCLHQAVTTRELSAELRGRLAALGIADRVDLDPLGARPLEDAELNRLYGACDVGLNTSMGEGWGLVSCEHAAAGGAQIVPRHSACAEIWEGAAELVEPARRYVPRFSMLEMAEVAPREVAGAILRLYRDPERCRVLAKCGYLAMQRPDRDWPVLATRLETSLLGGIPFV